MINMGVKLAEPITQPNPTQQTIRIHTIKCRQGPDSLPAEDCRLGDCLRGTAPIGKSTIHEHLGNGMYWVWSRVTGW